MPDPEAPGPPRGDGLLTFGAVAAVFVLSVVVGAISSFYATDLAEVGPIHLSIGAVIAGVFTLVGGIAASRVLDARDAALLPGLGWFAGLALLVFIPTGGGDVLVPGSGDDVYAFVVAGVGGATAAGLIAYRGAWAAMRAGSRSGGAQEGPGEGTTPKA